MKATQMNEYPRRDITPEHTARGQKEGLHGDVIAAYRYVDAVVDTAGITDFRSAGKKSRELLERLVAKRTR